MIMPRHSSTRCGAVWPLANQRSIFPNGIRSNSARVVPSALSSLSAINSCSVLLCFRLATELVCPECTPEIYRLPNWLPRYLVFRAAQYPHPSLPWNISLHQTSLVGLASTAEMLLGVSGSTLVMSSRYRSKTQGGNSPVSMVAAQLRRIRGRGRPRPFRELARAPAAHL
jgi:hypothetical protein